NEVTLVLPVFGVQHNHRLAARDGLDGGGYRREIAGHVDPLMVCGGRCQPVRPARSGYYRHRTRGKAAYRMSQGGRVERCARGLRLLMLILSVGFAAGRLQAAPPTEAGYHIVRDVTYVTRDDGGQTADLYLPQAD